MAKAWRSPRCCKNISIRAPPLAPTSSTHGSRPHQSFTAHVEAEQPPQAELERARCWRRGAAQPRIDLHLPASSGWFDQLLRRSGPACGPQPYCITRRRRRSSPIGQLVGAWPNVAMVGSHSCTFSSAMCSITRASCLPLRSPVQGQSLGPFVCRSADPARIDLCRPKRPLPWRM